MKKVLSLLLLLSFVTSQIEAREMVILKKDGKRPDEMSITREPAINKNRILIDDFEDGDFKSRLDTDSGAWNYDPIEEDTSCFPEFVAMPAPELSEKVLKLTYDIESKKDARNGYWIKLKNVDATAYDHLEFFVKGDREAGFTTRFKIEIKKYKDQEKRIDKLTAYQIIEGVTESWQKVSIPLGKFSGITDWKDLDEIVIVFHDRINDKKEGVLYFDNLRFVKTDNPGMTIFDGRGSKIRKTYLDLDAKSWNQWKISRLRGYPKEVFVDKKFPKDDKEFFMEIARDTWKFFDDIVDKKSHLVLDTIIMAEDGVYGKGADAGDYTNVTNIGMYLVCLVAAYDLGFISKEDAALRAKNTLISIERLETHHNFLFNYYDTTTMERTDNLVSLVDNGWLTAGVMMVKLAFPENETVVEVASNLLSSWDYSFFYNEVDQHFYHGFYTNVDSHSNFNYGPFYSEPRIISYIAVARGDVPLEHWFKLNRTFPEGFSWQSQTPKNRNEKEYKGVKYFGGHYEYDGKKYIPSWGRLFI